MFFAALQCVLFDLPKIERENFSIEIIGYIFGFVVCLFLMYVNTSSFLQKSDAILFNLSLLTSDVYAVVFTYFFSGYLVNWLYFLSFVLVMCGLLVYHSEKAPQQLGEFENDNENDSLENENSNSNNGDGEFLYNKLVGKI
jgi:solute carrier family 35 protein F1/2